MARALQAPWTVHPVTLSFGDPNPSIPGSLDVYSHQLHRSAFLEIVF
jgi:hypothetical protein